MYVGIDYHKRYSIATQIDEKGAIIDQTRFNNDSESIRAYLGALPEGSKIAIEATGNWYYFYEQTEDFCTEIHLAHPLKTKAIASAKIKTDRIDSTILGQLLRTEMLPTSYIPSRGTRDIREILRYRASLVEMRTMIKNKVHAVLSKNGIILEYSDIFGKKAMKHLRGIPLRPCYRIEVDGYLGLVESLNQHIGAVDGQIKSLALASAQAQLLITIPGISYYSALLILTEIGEVARFASAKQLCSYAGLVPSVHASGGKTHYGHLTKQGSKWLRWILVELAHHFTRGSARLARMYARIANKHGIATARVAVARDMLKIMYIMLKYNRPFFRD
jgi:transposase